MPRVPQRVEQRRRADRLEKDDARADRERQQQVGHLRERVEERQHAEHRVRLVDRDDRERRVPLGVEVGVRQHDALGIGRGAGRVEDDGGVARGDVRDRRRGGRARKIGGVRDAWRVAREQHQARRRVRPPARTAAFAVSRYRGVVNSTRAPLLAEDRADLRRLVGRVERHGDGAEPQRAEVRGDPARVVVGEDRDAIAARRRPRRASQAATRAGAVHQRP